MERLRFSGQLEAKKRVIAIGGLVSLATLTGVGLVTRQEDRVPAIVVDKEDVLYSQLKENNCRVEFSGQTSPLSGPFRDVEPIIQNAIEPMFPAITTSVQCGFSTNAGPKPSQPEVYLLDLNNCADESTKPDCNYTVVVDKQTFKKNSIGSQFQP